MCKYENVFNFNDFFHFAVGFAVVFDQVEKSYKLTRFMI